MGLDSRSVIDGITLYANLLVLKFNYSYFIIIIILKCYLFYPAGDYDFDYTKYDCDCRVGYFLFSYVTNFLTTTYIFI